MQAHQHFETIMQVHQHTETILKLRPFPLSTMYILRLTGLFNLFALFIQGMGLFTLCADGEIIAWIREQPARIVVHPLSTLIFLGGAYMSLRFYYTTWTFDRELGTVFRRARHWTGTETMQYPLHDIIDVRWEASDNTYRVELVRRSGETILLTQGHARNAHSIQHLAAITRDFINLPKDSMT